MGVAGRPTTASTSGTMVRNRPTNVNAIRVSLRCGRMVVSSPFDVSTLGGGVRGARLREGVDAGSIGGGAERELRRRNRNLGLPVRQVDLELRMAGHRLG